MDLVRGGGQTLKRQVVFSVPVAPSYWAETGPLADCPLLGLRLA